MATMTDDTSKTTSEISETEYLRVRSEEAKRAITESLNQAKALLANKVDPRQIAVKHPIITIASATVTGFVAALAAIPSKKELELRRLERLNRAMHPETAPHVSNGKAKDAVAPTTIWMTVMHELINLLKPILLTAVTAGVKSATTPPPENSNSSYGAGQPR